MKKKNYIFIFLVLMIPVLIIGYAKENSKQKNLINTNLTLIEDVNFFNNNSNIIVYFGRPTCPNCNMFTPTLEEVLKSRKEKIYYFNTDYWRSDEKFEEILTKYSINSIPVLINIKDENSFEKLDLLGDGLDLTDTDLVKQEIVKFIEQ